MLKIMSEQSGKKIFQRFFLIASGLVFLSSSGVFLVRLLLNPATNSPQSVSSANTSNEEQLRNAEQGYLQVLTREPNNPLALQGLVDTRLKLNDLAGAIAPMETLIELYPQEENLKALLEVIKQQAKQNSDNAAPESQQTPEQK